MSQQQVRCVMLLTQAMLFFVAMSSADGSERLTEGRLRIEISVTPGKSSAPTESISLLRTDRKFTLEVARRSAKGEPQIESVPITKEEFDGIKDIVEESNLLVWLPPNKAPEGKDKTHRRFLVEWQPLHLSRPNVHSVGWSGELSGKNQSMKLLRATIAKLAVGKLKKVKLYYFGKALR